MLSSVQHVTVDVFSGKCDWYRFKSCYSSQFSWNV